MDGALSGFKKMRFWGADLMVSRLRKAVDSCNNICDTTGFVSTGLGKKIDKHNK